MKFLDHVKKNLKFTKKEMSREINPFYEQINADTTKVLEGYCIGYEFKDSTDIIVKNIKEFVTEKYSIWLMDKLEVEFDLFRATRHSSISAYVIKRLYTLLNTNNPKSAGKNSILCLFLNISLMQNLALKIELELKLRPKLMYPRGVSKRANWNIVLPTYSCLHSFIAENLFILKNNQQKIRGWKIFEKKENLNELNKIFYPTASVSTFDLAFVCKLMQKVKRTPQICRPVSGSFNNRRKLRNFTETATFAIYFES